MGQLLFDSSQSLGEDASCHANPASFSVAFSGGGVRAAAFQAGVLWQLAEQELLGNVEHLCAVSGGAYVASAFASQLEKAREDLQRAQLWPKVGSDLNAWYMGIVAKTIDRMQRNTGYLTRDISEPSERWSWPKDSSSTLPRIFDLPILICVLVCNMAINSATVFVLFMVPFVELMNHYHSARGFVRVAQHDAQYMESIGRVRGLDAPF